MPLSKEGQTYEDEFRSIMQTFQDRHDESTFDPLPILTRVAEILEWATTEYFSNNIDPLDSRHPLKVLPDCALGHILRFLHRSTDFFDKAMVTYLMPHERREVNIMAARVLVSSLPVLDAGCFTTDVIKELYNYALTSDSTELRAYSTLLLNAGMTPETAHTYRLEIFQLIADSLKRLRQLYDQMVSNEPSSSVDTNQQSNGVNGPTDFSELQNEETANQSVTSSTDPNTTEDVSKLQTPNTTQESVMSKETSSTKKRILEWDDTKNDIPAKRARSSFKKDTAFLDSPDKIVRNGGCTPLADRYNDGLSNCSSTVDDMRRIIIGNNQIYPLTIEMEQRMILQFLQSICDFIDHLSVLSENNALEIIMRYLNVNEYNDIRLLFEALYCLGTMLIHLRLAWDFVNLGGLSKLIAVNRQSVASVSVCVCFHHISQFIDVMEHICQGPSKLLDDIVEYSLWQLAHGYESAGARICGFMGYSLSFKNILDRFEHMDGLRVLYNYASSRVNEFLDADFENEYDRIQEKMADYGVILRNTCTVLQRYMLSHVLLKYESVKRHNPNSRLNVTSGRMALKDLCKKPLVLEPESEPKALELLLNTLPFSGTWHATNALRNLGFINFFIRILGVRNEYQFQMSIIRMDSIKLILNILRLATVSPGVVNDLCDLVKFKESNASGIGILLNLIENDSDEDCEMIKVILRILVHCFCGPETPTTSAPNPALSTQFGTPVTTEKFRSPADALATLNQKRLGKHPRYFHEDNKTANVLKRAWQCAQLNNAIMILIAYIRQPQPLTEADCLRNISCRALNGLAKHEPIRQILSQLPLIVNNEIAVLLREPILQDKHAEHAEFRQQACKLIQIVQKAPIEFVSQENMTLGTMWKNLVIKQTSIRYDENELLKLIQDHLRNKGLNATANQLEKEAGPLLNSMLVPSKSLIMPRTEIADPNHPVANQNQSTIDLNETPRSVLSPTNDDLPHTVSVSTPKSTFLKTSLPSSNSKSFKNMKTRHNISFATPKNLHARTFSESKRRTMGSSSLLAQSSMPFSNKHQENVYSYVQQPVEFKPQKSLGDIVTDYFRHQHSACEKPIVTCPPFSFYFPHRCPKPQASYSLPINAVDRFLARQALPFRRTHAMFNRCDRNMLFSHYSSVRTYDVEDETITACNLSFNDESVQLGMYSGDVHWVNLETGTTEMTFACHNSIVSSIRQSTDGSLLLTSSLYVRPLSALWRLGDAPEVIHSFQEDTEMDFGQLGKERIIGTQMYTATVYDTETGELLSSFYDSNPINKYSRNKACFNCTDTLVLNDGIIWDVRASPTEYVHKFDKLSNEYSGLFHPNDLEVLICGQVWDVRTYKLLLNVPSLESCDYFFNKTGDILFATSVIPQDEEFDDHFNVKYDSSFRVLDSKDYHVVTTFDTKRDLLAFCPDHRDRHICTVEMARNREDEQTVCRLYEVGKIRSENDEEEEEDEENTPDDDEDEFSFDETSSNSSLSSQSSVSTTELIMNGYQNFEPANDEDLEDEQSSGEGEDNDDDYDQDNLYDDEQSDEEQELEYYDEDEWESDNEEEN